MHRFTGAIHVHNPEYKKTYTTQSGGELFYEVYVYRCTICGRQGQQERFPKHDAGIIWTRKQYTD